VLSGENPTAHERKGTTEISGRSGITELAAEICQHLHDRGIEAVLSGGAVVSIYSDDRYLSADLDFITLSRMDAVEEAMAEIGFTRSSGRCFSRRDTDMLVEFPPGPLSIGDAPVRLTRTIQVGSWTLNLLTPTQCVMDRLAAYYHWDDEQALEQALLVAGRNEVDLGEIRTWSIRERNADKYAVFLERTSSNG
jgi:hypothetical protein